MQHLSCAIERVCTLWFAGYSNAGVAAAVSLCMAAVSWPSLLGLPYLLLLSAAVTMWSKNRTDPSSSRCLRVLQVYTGAQRLWCLACSASQPLQCLLQSIDAVFSVLPGLSNDTKDLHAGVHILLLYLWQISLIKRAMWQGASDWMGLYELTHSQPLHISICQVCHCHVHACHSVCPCGVSSLFDARSLGQSCEALL